MQGSPLTRFGHPVRLACAAAVAVFLSACGDSPTSPAREASGGPRHVVELTGVEATACAPGYSGDWPHCVPTEAPPPDPWSGTGGTGGGGGSPGTVGGIPEGEGPILGTIACLVGLGLSGFTVHDVYDQAKVTIEAKWRYDFARQQLGYGLSVYGPAWANSTERWELEQKVVETRTAFMEASHQLGDKMGVSTVTVVSAMLACGAAIIIPSP